MLIGGEAEGCLSDLVGWLLERDFSSFDDGRQSERQLRGLSL